MPVQRGGQYRGTLHRGYHRGLYQWTLELVKHLGRDQIIESKTFYIELFPWALVCFIDPRKRGKRKWLTVQAVSRSPECLHAFTKLQISRNGTQFGHLERVAKTVCPFGYIASCSIPLDEAVPSPRSPLDNDLIINLELKDVREADETEKEEIKEDLKEIPVETINRRTIEKWLNDHTWGVVSPFSDPTTKVYSGSLVRYWARHALNDRYWRCERRAVCGLLVTGCLNRERPFTSFANISGDAEGSPIVTVFGENKRSSEKFKRIFPDTGLVFFKISEPVFEQDLGFICASLVREKTQVQAMLEEIVREVPALSHASHWRAQVEMGPNRFQDITDVQATVAECGIETGAVILLTVPRTS